MKFVREDIKRTEARWDRFTKWLSPKDPDLLNWKKHFEKDGIPCKIKKEAGRAALFVFQRWSVPRYGSHRFS